MKTSFKSLLLLAAFGAFAATSCSQAEQNKAENTMENTADAAANTVDNTVDSVQADMAPEPGDTAVVRDQPANGMVEETNK